MGSNLICRFDFIKVVSVERSSKDPLTTIQFKKSDDQEHVVYRYYKDYLWLYVKLLESFQDCVVVPPPSLRRTNVLSPTELNEVSDCLRIDLERFLTKIGRNSRLGQSESFQVFLDPSEHDLEKRRPPKINMMIKHPSSIKLPSTLIINDSERSIDERKYAALAYESSLQSAETIVDRCFEARKNFAASLRDVANGLNRLYEMHSDEFSKEVFQGLSSKISLLSENSLDQARIEGEIFGRFCGNFANIITAMKMALHRRYSLLSEANEASKLTRKKKEAHEKLKFATQSKLDKLEKAKLEWDEAESNEKHLREEVNNSQNLICQELNECETYRVEAYYDWIRDFVIQSFKFEKKGLEAVTDHHV